MKLLGLLQPLLFAVGKKPVHWYIDGDNVLGRAKTTGSRDHLIDALQNLRGAEEIVLVFDGCMGKQTEITQNGILRTVSLGEGLESDDFILGEIKELSKKSEFHKHRFNLVSADRDLRKKVGDFKPLLRTLIDPRAFFRRYLPRMKGLKRSEN